MQLLLCCLSAPQLASGTGQMTTQRRRGPPCSMRWQILRRAGSSCNQMVSPTASSSRPLLARPALFRAFLISMITCRQRQPAPVACLIWIGTAAPQGHRRSEDMQPAPMCSCRGTLLGGRASQVLRRPSLMLQCRAGGACCSRPQCRIGARMTATVVSQGPTVGVATRFLCFMPATHSWIRAMELWCAPPSAVQGGAAG